MKITLLALFSIKLMAIDLSNPKMLTQMLKQKQQRLSQITCHNDSIKLNETEIRNRESFLATVKCNIKCVNNESKMLSIEKQFRPDELSLSAGDGSGNNFTIWRSLGITINIFRKQACYDLAKSTCSDSVDSFQSLSIESGDWKLDKEINCKAKALTRSPFDPSFKLKQKNNIVTPMPLSFSPFSFQKAITGKNTVNKIEEFFLDIDSLKKLESLSQCKKKLIINSCFGDCVYDDPSEKLDFIETLSTPQPLGDDAFELCLDSSIEKLKSSSTSVSIFKCEKLVWEYVRASGVSGESCAAMRYNTNCKDLF